MAGGPNRATSGLSRCKKKRALKDCTLVACVYRRNYDLANLKGRTDGTTVSQQTLGHCRVHLTTARRFSPPDLLFNSFAQHGAIELAHVIARQGCHLHDLYRPK